MLSIERAKELLDNLALSDKEVEEIRDEYHALAEIIFEKWQAEQLVNKKHKKCLK